MIYLDSMATGSYGRYLNSNAAYAYTEKRLIAELDDRVKKVLKVNDGVVVWGQNTTQLVKLLSQRTGGFDVLNNYEHDCIYNESDNCSYVYTHMLVNNITGDCFNHKCKVMGEKCREDDYFFLMDCTAAIGHVKLPDDLADWCDAVVFSGHKFNGGFTAAMWLSKRLCDWYGIKNGDDVAGGTADVAGRKDMVEALEWAHDNIEFNDDYCRYLAHHLDNALHDALDSNFRFICNTKNHAVAINAIRLNGINADALQLFLASRGVYIGRGTSACDSSKAGYRVLTKGYGLTEKEASEVIRVSFGPDTTTTRDIDTLVELIKEYKERFADESEQ